MTTKLIDTEVICFAGDSGDGMQLLGDQFSRSVALFGNDVATLPDFPAEIRAPAGTLSGVSAFQVQFANHEVHSPGDEFNVLVALNAAALKKHLHQLSPGGIILADEAGFSKKSLELAGYRESPLTDHSLDGYRIITANFTQLTQSSLDLLSIPAKQIKKCKNFFILGIALWMFNRPTETTEQWLKQKFTSSPELAEANILALRAGYHYAETADFFGENFQVAPASLAKGHYRNLSGNEAITLGLICAAEKMERPLFLGSYPITPASDILHILSGYKHAGVKTFQAEDEIAAACAALGASYAGALGVTSTSGPGLCLKSETINLAVMTELPLVIINVQRAGPSTGLPTKTEQSDLMFSLYGRSGDSPLPVLAADSPADCFTMAMEASRIAAQFMTPVILLSDGYLGNGAEPWQIPDIASFTPEKKLKSQQVTRYQPYLRDPSTLAREWVIAGTPEKAHRIGGLEKQSNTGTPSHDPDNHQKMTRERANKIQGISQFIPKQAITGELSDTLLVISWGSTKGTVSLAIKQLREKHLRVAHIHLQYLNPFPSNLAGILSAFEHVLVMELNDQQLVKVIRAEFAIDAQSYTQTTGMPFKVKTVVQHISQTLQGIKNEQ